MMTSSQRLDATMDAFRLLRSGRVSTYPALKSGLSEMYPDATEEEIRKCITRMAQMVEQNSDSEEDEDD
jgi:hypothetical protein